MYVSDMDLGIYGYVFMVTRLTLSEGATATL